MFREQLTSYLRAANFYSLPTNLPEFTAFVKVEHDFLNVLQIFDYQRNLYLSTDQFQELKEAVKAIFREQGVTEVHIMSLVLCDDLVKARAFVQNDKFCWFFDKRAKKLIIEKDRVADFYGMKSFLLEFLDNYEEEASKQDENLPKKETILGKLQNTIIDLPKATASLVIINIVIFIICIFLGNTLYQAGQVGLEYIKNYEYYRLLTAMFLHAGIDHIFGNMLLLYFIGNMLERVIGQKKFLIIYIFSGVIGNIVSCIYEFHISKPMVSVGASGGIFGLVGAMLYLVIRKNKRIEISLTRMLFMVAYCIYSSFVGDNINIAAHFGGLVAGFFITFLLCQRRKKCES